MEAFNTFKIEGYTDLKFGVLFLFNFLTCITTTITFIWSM